MESPRGIEDAGEDVVIGGNAVLLNAKEEVPSLVPTHDEIAGIVHGHGRIEFIAAGGIEDAWIVAWDIFGIDAELAADSIAVLVEIWPWMSLK